jgi:predicted ATPase
MNTLGRALATQLNNLARHPALLPSLTDDSIWRATGVLGQSQQQSAMLRWLENGRMLAVQGEPGSGKTSLLRWLAEQAKARPLKVIQAQTPFYRVPYGIWRNILLQIHPNLEHANQDACNRFLEGLEPGSGVRTGLLWNLLRLEYVNDPQLASYNTEQRRSAVMTLLSLILHKSSLHTPLLLLVEDIHLADEASNYVLNHLAELPHFKQSDISIALTTTDKVPAGFETLSPTPLNAETVHQMSRSLFGEGGSDDAVTKIIEQTKGNPLYVRLLLEASEKLEESDTLGAIIQEQEGNPLYARLLRDAREDLDEAIALEVLIQEKIGSLPSDLRHLLFLAARIGPQFSLGELAELLPHQTNLEGMLRQLMPFVECITARHYSFRNFCYCKQAAVLCPSEIAQAAHEALARYYEQNDPSQSLLIAYHYQNSSTPQQARNYWVRSAHLAHARGSYHDALEVISQTARGHMSDMEAFAILKERADLCHELGQHEEQEKALQELTSLAQRTRDAWLHADSGWRWLRYYHQT